MVSVYIFEAFDFYWIFGVFELLSISTIRCETGDFKNRNCLLRKNLKPEHAFTIACAIKEFVSKNIQIKKE